jgi:hypothetical protein
MSMVSSRASALTRRLPPDPIYTPIDKTSFYEALGGQRVRERREMTGGVEVMDVAYGWLDARLLIDVQERQPQRPGT